MFNLETLAVTFGLFSAAAWGAGDFSGGFAAKRSNVYSVVIISQFVGAILLLALALFLGKPVPSVNNLLLGGIAGISGVIGLVALYSGLAKGQMGIIAPITAVIAAILPILVGLFIEGWPSVTQLFGFGTAIIAVWFLTRTGVSTPLKASDLGFAITAGLGFGFFFILFGQAGESGVLWPLIAARTASVSFLLIVALSQRQWHYPPVNQLPIIIVAGIFDTAGNAFFALSTQIGRLDIAAVLASLYPVSTILLARFLLKERLMSKQWLGIIVAIVALVLIAA